jgi:hypothetical protein
MYRKKQKICSKKLIELMNRFLLNTVSVKTSLTNLLLLTLYNAYPTIPVSFHTDVAQRSQSTRVIFSSYMVVGSFDIFLPIMFGEKRL